MENLDPFRLYSPASGCHSGLIESPTGSCRMNTTNPFSTLLSNSSSSAASKGSASLSSTLTLYNGNRRSFESGLRRERICKTLLKSVRNNCVSLRMLQDQSAITRVCIVGGGTFTGPSSKTNPSHDPPRAYETRTANLNRVYVAQNIATHIGMRICSLSERTSKFTSLYSN